MAEKKSEKKTKIYLVKIQPSRHNVSAQGAFGKIPTKDELKTMAEIELRGAGAPEYLVKSVLANIDIYGVPSVNGESGESFVQWKMKGESIHNSKGYVAMKTIPLY